MAKIGDLVAKSGLYTEPGVVVEKNPDGTVMIDTEPSMVSKYHRYINTSGLEAKEKEKFNAILDQIYKHDDDMEKLNEIQKEIDELRADPESQNIVQYLRNQQAILVRQTKALPRYYTKEESQIKA